MPDSSQNPLIEDRYPTTPGHQTGPIISFWAKLVRTGFALFYNQFAFTYDPVSWIVSLGLWREWQKAALPYIRGPRVLELAHGPGHMLVTLYQEGFNVTGIDLSPNMGRLASARAKQSDIRIDLVRSHAQITPFTDSTFDTVLSTFPTEFILEDSTLKSVFRILKPGGQLIVIPSAQLTNNNPIVHFIEWLYVITGQRSPGPISRDSESIQANERYKLSKDNFLSSGFNLTIKKVQVKNSVVTLMIAQK